MNGGSTVLACDVLLSFLVHACALVAKIRWNFICTVFIIPCTNPVIVRRREMLARKRAPHGCPISAARERNWAPRAERLRTF
jgi:hypothetical protein